MTDPAEQLECYLVGGAVRDQLLGDASTDLDWVVVGASEDTMLKLGFSPVGRDFPVYLHPTTHQEYALARRERKTGPGYRGFETTASPDVTLEDDLSRRDITINAMARSRQGKLIDPWGGATDLAAGVIRHVSPAFTEDPLRVLRVARFTARYHDRGFGVATETLTLMESMVTDGELGTLPPERIWQELSGALSAAQPAEFFRTLRRCGALGVIFPELDALFGVPQPQAHHPEGDAGIHTLLVLEQAAKLSPDSKIRFAALVHDLGKGATPPQHWPKHIGHEKRGLKLVGEMCDRLRVPAEYRRLALLVTEFHLLMHRLETLRPQTVLKLLNRLDAFRNPDRVGAFVLACEADAQGRGTGLAADYPSTKLLQAYLEAVTALSFSDLEATTTDGRARGREVRKRRLAALGSVQMAWRDSATSNP